METYFFLLSLLYVLHTDSPVPVKQNPAGQAAHLCLQVGPAQRGPQVGAGCAPPLPCTHLIITYKYSSSVECSENVLFEPL